MNLKDPEEARKEGRDAAAAGKRIYDNPYPAAMRKPADADRDVVEHALVPLVVIFLSG